jgi:hypothetical protein
MIGCFKILLLQVVQWFQDDYRGKLDFTPGRLADSYTAKSGCVQDADKGQIPIPLGVVQSVAHDKDVRNLKPHIIGIHLLNPPAWLIQQYAGAKATGLERTEGFEDALQGAAGVENVVHHQNITSADIQSKFLGKHELARRGPTAVTGNPDKIQTEGDGEMPNEIREENDRTVEKRDDHKIPSTKVTFNSPSKAADAPRDPLL